MAGRPAPLNHPAEAAQSHYRRMLRLREMDAPALARLLSGDPAAAAPWVESAAVHGLAEAQVRLGRMLLEGEGLERDRERALAWFVRAGNAGNGEAMNMAGRCHENGWGTAADASVAAGWYRRAARAGDAWGQYNWANLLFDGNGVKKDRTLALRLYRNAADQGHARAMNLLARCCEEGWGAPADRAAARHWYRRSAEAGYFRAQFNHATLLSAEGRWREALAWFEKACEAAPADSREMMIGVLKRHGDPRLAELAARLEGAAS